MPRPYLVSLTTIPGVLYNPHTTSSLEQTGDITNCSQFEEGIFSENEHNLVEEESILASIDEPFTDNNFDD